MAAPSLEEHAGHTRPPDPRRLLTAPSTSRDARDRPARLSPAPGPCGRGARVAGGRSPAPSLPPSLPGQAVP